MKHIITSASITFASLIVSSTLATAQMTEHSQQAHQNAVINAKNKLQALDINNDGKWSAQEVFSITGLTKHFAHIDVNQDGFLTKEELKSHHQAKKLERKARFEKVDANKDGQFSKEEVTMGNKKKLSENFDAIDADKNGQLSQDELKANWKKRHQDMKVN